jgi:hypothetical protein
MSQSYSSPGHRGHNRGRVVVLTQLPIIPYVAFCVFRGYLLKQ